MHARRVSLRPTLRQLPLAFVALLSCGLSGWLTFRFCAQLCPQEGLIELVAIGIIWEASKLLLGAYGMATLVLGTPFERVKSACLVAISLVLALGSVAASLGFLVQSDARQQQLVLAASAPHKRDSQSHVDLTTAIERHRSLARHFESKNRLTVSKEEDRKADDLVQKRADLSANMEKREKAPALSSGTSDFFANIAAAVPNKATNPNVLRLGSQCVLAIMLEVISMIMLSMLRTTFLFEKAPRPRVPADFDDKARLHLVHGKRQSAKSRTQTGTSAARTQKRTSQPRMGRGDTGVGDEWAHRYEEVKSLIAAGKLSPTYREIRRHAECGHAIAERFIAAMMGENILRRQGRRHVPSWTAAA